jgi:hypothetical protein
LRRWHKFSGGGLKSKTSNELGWAKLYKTIHVAPW